MDVIRGILIILLVVASDISFYYWGRRDGLDLAKHAILEYFADELMKKEKEWKEKIDECTQSKP